MNFSHLHLHTDFSLLDGLTTPEEAAKRAASFDQEAMVISDHGSMGGILRFQKACQANGVKPVFGCEFYFVPSLEADHQDKRAERFHLIVLAKNDDGLHKMFKVMKSSWTTGFYYKPRIEFSDLEYLGNDVVVLSGCMGSILSQSILNGDDWVDTEKLLAKFVHCVPDFYIELQPWNDFTLNCGLMDLALSWNIPYVGTIDCHFPSEREKGYEEILLCIGQYPSLGAAALRHARETEYEVRHEPDLVKRINAMYPDRRLRFDKIDLYIMSSEEVAARFREAGFPQAEILENSCEVVDKCNALIPTNRKLLPKYSPEPNASLGELCAEALGDLGLEYRQRLDEELAIIKELGFANYFLIIWDVVNWADKEGIARGPSRGSVGGSLVAYLLGITSIDPIKHKLLFSRFIDPNRNDYPDIDLDFEDRRRDEVKQYCKDRWGEDHVAGITTYGDFKAKSAVKDVARVLGVDYNEANAITPHFETLEDLEKSEKASQFVKKYPGILDASKALTGRIRNAGAHAGGVVVSELPLYEVLPIESRNLRGTDGRIEVTALDMKECEELGLIKFDFLGIKSLAVIVDAVKSIRQRHNVDIAYTGPGELRLDGKILAMNDPDIYKEFSDGNTVGVWQAEAIAYRNLLMRMGVETFSDLAVSNALVRPGAFVTQGESYIARKQGKQQVRFVNDKLKPYMEETYGMFIYQEQLMQAVVDLADFTWSEADTLRKIIGKKRDVSEFKPFEEKWFENSVKNISHSEARKMWEDFEQTSAYLFNKSHSVGYAVLSYQTMWLKINYPVEFIWALLKNEDKPEDITTYLLEADRLGIEILPPDVNLSNESFSLENECIRFGLTSVKGVGKAALKEIKSKRPFSSFEEFTNKCIKRAVKSHVIEALDKIGAFQSMGRSEYEHKKYYLPILNFPIYAGEGSIFNDVLTDCADIDEKSSDMKLVRGIVKSTKKKPHYFRVEIEDATGVTSAFADKDMDISSRDYILALIGDNTLHGFADAVEDDIGNDFLRMMKDIFLNKKMEHDLSEYGVTTLEPDEKSLVYAINVKRIRTKAGKPMAFMYVWDGERFEKIVVFPRNFAQLILKLKSRQWMVIKTEEASSGGLCLLDAISVEDFLEIKKKQMV